ncbi:MAG: VWA domain-containing protein [Acidobacteriia bacterium]|nr:VWA domain-containing protein [Terriglobia bacterium]
MKWSRWALSLLSLAISGSSVGSPAVGNPCLQRSGQGVRDNYKLKVDVALVTVDATVRDSRGTIVDGLQIPDFAIYDNGVLQEITHLSRDQLPLAVALVVDCSPSISRYLKELRTAALAALALLKPEDQVVLFSLGLCPVRLTNLTSDHGQVVDKIGRLELDTGTNIYDALAVSARYLREAAPDRRHAIILISDDYSEMSHYTAPETLQEMLTASVTLFNIKTLGDNGFVGRAKFSVNGMPLDEAKVLPNTNLTIPGLIERIARETGGTVFNLGSGGKLSQAFETAINNLKLQYTLGFTPLEARGGEGFHQLQVKLSGARPCPGCKVQARSGYYRLASSVSRNAIESTATLFDCEEFKTALENKVISMAASNSYELHAVFFQAATGKETGPDGMPQIRVRLKIDSSSVHFKTVGDLHSVRLRVGIVYADSKGNDLGSENGEINLKLGEGDYAEVKRWGIPFAATVPLKVPKEVLKIVVLDPAAGKVGSKFLKVK